MRSRLGGVAASLLVAMSGCGGDITASTPSPSPADTTAQLVVAPRMEEPPFNQSLAPGTSVPAVLQATLPASPAGVIEEIELSVRETEGVVAIARVGLGNVRTQSDSGSADVSLVWADPAQFRPFSPSVTAQADFVWRGMRGGQVFLAHEESRLLAAVSGSKLFMQGPSGLRALRVGGVASNGTPNFAGGLISSGQARVMGLASPNLLLVGKDPKASLSDLQRQLKKKLPSIRFDTTAAGAGRAFLTGADSAKLFGTFTFTRNEDGSIVPDAGWVSRNIVSKNVSILGGVRCHRLLIPQLAGALKEIEQQGASQVIDVTDYHRSGGCYVPRLIRGEDPNRAVSMHAWGLALDLNVARNAPGAAPNQDPRLVSAFERWGFRWGGRWSPPDAHHFELASLIKR